MKKEDTNLKSTYSMSLGTSTFVRSLKTGEKPWLKYTFLNLKLAMESQEYHGSVDTCLTSGISKNLSPNS